MGNANVTLEQIRRAEKLEVTIHDLLEKGKRNPIEYLNILQAVNDNQQIIINPKVFLTLVEQFECFKTYNGWLKIKHPEYVIPKEDFKIEETFSIFDPHDWLFYCHGGDVVLTAGLAWEYAGSYREYAGSCRKTFKAGYIFFEEGYMAPAEDEPARPSGFYVMTRPAEDRYVIGARFKDKSVETVRKELRTSGDWGMGCEGLQLLCITQVPYTKIIDGNNYLSINLPGLALSPSANNVFSVVHPYLNVRESTLELCGCHIDNGSNCYFSFHRGSGSLRQPK